MLSVKQHSRKQDRHKMGTTTTRNLNFLYLKSLRSFVAAAVCDNCCMNGTMFRRLGPTSVECHSLWYHFAVEHVNCRHEDVLEKMRQVGKQLSFGDSAANLRKLTHFQAKPSNETKKGSTHQMVLLILHLLEFISTIDNDELSNLISKRKILQSYGVYAASSIIAILSEGNFRARPQL